MIQQFFPPDLITSLLFPLALCWSVLFVNGLSINSTGPAHLFGSGLSPCHRSSISRCRHCLLNAHVAPCSHIQRALLIHQVNDVTSLSMATLSLTSDNFYKVLPSFCLVFILPPLHRLPSGLGLSSSILFSNYSPWQLPSVNVNKGCVIGHFKQSWFWSLCKGS